MQYLIDTNVFSETTKESPDQRVVDWLDRFGSLLVTSDLVLGEVQFGISRLRAGARRDYLEGWYRKLLLRFGQNIIPFDTRVAIAWGRYRAEWLQKGYEAPVQDGMIAATARFHGLTVATRNVADYEKTGCEVLNPFES